VFRVIDESFHGRAARQMLVPAGMKCKITRLDDEHEQLIESVAA
jgi:hypothetical protein